jgi:hypothetical protein
MNENLQEIITYIYQHSDNYSGMSAYNIFGNPLRDKNDNLLSLITNAFDEDIVEVAEWVHTELVPNTNRGRILREGDSE